MKWKSKSKMTGAYVPPSPSVPDIVWSKQVPELPKPKEPFMSEGKLPTYQNYIEVRDLDVEKGVEGRQFLEGENLWFWIKEDNGAFTGPAHDWESSHHKKYFEHVKQFRTVITAGANQGMYVRHLAKKFNMVYAFEPDPLNFHCMVINNQRDNVVKIQGALGDRRGMTTIRRNGFSNTGTWCVDHLPGGPIPMFMLDDFTFEALDLIQLDVEGFEIWALHGARNQIMTHKPVVILENGKTTQIKTFMEAIGYVDVDQSVADTIWIPK